MDMSKKNTPKAAETAAIIDSDKDKEEKNEGDPLFRGMKYRLIGPFRGGRSLTAVGIPGDPTTYYFGATWDRSGDFTSHTDWEKYVARFAARRDAPLQATVGN